MQAAHGSLLISTVATETFSVKDADKIIVHLVSGVGPVYVTVDGSTPTVGGDNCWVLYRFLPSLSVQVSPSATQTVKMISAAVATYAIEVVE